MIDNRREKRDWLTAVVVFPLVALLLAACGAAEPRTLGASAAPARPVAVASAAVEERMLPGSLDVTGALMADAQTDVAAEVNGRVTQVSVERGQAVRAGEALARLDQEDALNQLREAEATEAQTRERLGFTNGQPFDPANTPEVRQARITMERMEVDYQRYSRLVAEGAVSRQEHDVKRSEYLAAKEQYELALNQVRQLHQTLQAQRARVDMARKALADTVIRAPFAGVIAEKHVHVGQYLQRGSRVATLMRVDPLRAELSIPEVAAVSVRKGQKVSFSVQSAPDRTFLGTIAHVGPALRHDSRALIAEALVPNPGGALQPGLFATARIELPAARRSAFVPASAVRTEAGVSRLFVISNDRAELRFVQLGREVSGLVEVVQGVKPGERVAREGLDRLADGVSVTAPSPEGR